MEQVQAPARPLGWEKVLVVVVVMVVVVEAHPRALAGVVGIDTGLYSTRS